jgi:plasmid stabilization system protein ParE
MELIFHPGSARDARGIAARYSKISEHLAIRFWEEFDAAIEAIANHPERHHYDPSGMRRFNLKKFPYHILFEERLDCVRVIVVRHHQRNPSYGLRRQKK